jgi:hypothetical protein
MIDSRMEVGRFAGVLVLHQFASFAPPFFYPFMEDVLRAIWHPLRDTRVSVSESAGYLADRRHWSESEHRFCCEKVSIFVKRGTMIRHPISK